MKTASLNILIDATLLKFTEDQRSIYNANSSVRMLLTICLTIIRWARDAISSYLLTGAMTTTWGDGQADFITRQFLRYLSDDLSSEVKFYCLVDTNSYGLRIFSVYKYGSRRQYHQNIAQLNTKRLQSWVLFLTVRFQYHRPTPMTDCEQRLWGKLKTLQLKGKSDRWYVCLSTLEFTGISTDLD